MSSNQRQTTQTRRRNFITLASTWMPTPLLDGLLWPWPLTSRIYSSHQWGKTNIPCKFHQDAEDVCEISWYRTNECGGRTSRQHASADSVRWRDHRNKVTVT